MFVRFLDLDKATNVLPKPQDNNMALISFTCPRGSFQQILVNCTSCGSASCIQYNPYVYKNITNCSDSTSLSIYPITGNLMYNCEISTIKEGFTNAVVRSIEVQTSNLKRFFSDNNIILIV